MTKPENTPAHLCLECGAPMVYETRPDTIEYGGQVRTVDMLAWWCTKCDEAIFEGEPLAAREAVFLELKAEVDGVLSPTEVAAVRTKLGLSQRKASELLGGGPRSFYKYESGKQAVSVPMSHLLRLLDKDVARLQELGFEKVVFHNKAEAGRRLDNVIRGEKTSPKSRSTEHVYSPVRPVSSRMSSSTGSRTRPARAATRKAKSA